MMSDKEENLSGLMFDSGDHCYPEVYRLTSAFSFTNVKTSPIGSVNRNISASTRMLIQSDASSCTFSHTTAWGSGTCSWSRPQPGRLAGRPNFRLLLKCPSEAWDPRPWTPLFLPQALAHWDGKAEAVSNQHR